MQVENWIKNNVDVGEFFEHFKEDFKGYAYDSDTPVARHFVNSAVCKKFTDFIKGEISERLKNSSLHLLGKLGECEMPRVMLVEPTKPRLCHDERYLNLWMKETPFKLDTLKDVHRMVDLSASMICCDEKSGYDHVSLSRTSWAGSLRLLHFRSGGRYPHSFIKRLESK